MPSNWGASRLPIPETGLFEDLRYGFVRNPTENDNEGQATNKIRHWKLPSSIEEPPLKIRTWGAVERVGCEAGELRGGQAMMRLRRASVIAALSPMPRPRRPTPSVRGCCGWGPLFLQYQMRVPLRYIR